jgi:hypothetical protein
LFAKSTSAAVIGLPCLRFDCEDLLLLPLLEEVDLEPERLDEDEDHAEDEAEGFDFDDEDEEEDDAAGANPLPLLS